MTPWPKGPPRCKQTLSMAEMVPFTLATQITLSPIVNSLASPSGGRSDWAVSLMKGIAESLRTGRALLGWAGEDTCPCVVSFWLQRLRDHDLALEILHHAFIEPHFRGTLRQRHLVNLVLQLKQRVKQILRTRRASDHINVCGHDLVNSLQHSISIKGATYG